MRATLLTAMLMLSLGAGAGTRERGPAAAAAVRAGVGAKGEATMERSKGGFDAVADEALLAMRARAAEMKITGVAVVATFEGETIEAWSSKMVVVGRYKDDPKASSDPSKAAEKGSNLLAIAYAKAAEMADTHKDSGTAGRAPMTGEFGWNGGVIERGRSGYLIAAFSGGRSEDDVEVSRAGMAKLKAGL